jgi:hypothetical protein
MPVDFDTAKAREDTGNLAARIMSNAMNHCHHVARLTAVSLTFHCNVDSRDFADGSVRETSDATAAATPDVAPESAVAFDGGGGPSTPSAGLEPCAGLPLSRCECAVGETTTCLDRYVSLGVCGERTLTCEPPGVWASGAVCAPASEELCDPGGQDDDCDGTSDEDCFCINGATEGCGNGSAGTRGCSEGRWGACRCLGESTVDLDQNGVPDAEETLLANGSVSNDLTGWQTETGDDAYESFVVNDADGLACSGAMRLSGLVIFNGVNPFTWIGNYAQQCAATNAASLSAAANARLVANSGDVSPILLTSGVDPSLTAITLFAFGTPDCSGAPLLEESTLFEQATDGSWQTLRSASSLPPGVQSVRVRFSIIGDDVEGLQSTALRLIEWDNLMAHPL